MRLSKSKVNSFLKCRREFKYRYIDEVEEEPNDAMQLGTDVHEIAEQFIKTGGIHSENYRVALQKLSDKQNSKFDLKIHLDHLANFFEDIFQNEKMHYEVFSVEDYLHDEYPTEGWTWSDRIVWEYIPMLQDFEAYQEREKQKSAKRRKGIEDRINELEKELKKIKDELK